MKSKPTLKEQEAIDNLWASRLIPLIRAGDKNAFVLLTAFYTLRLTAFLRGKLIVKFEAPDKVQDVVYELYKYLQTDDYIEKQNFGAWYFTFAWFTVYPSVMNQKLFTDIDESVCEQLMLDKVFKELINQETKDIVNKAISQLSEEDRIFFNLRYVEEKSYKEIGVIYIQSDDWASTKHRRIKAKLKNILIAMGIDFTILLN